MKQKCALVLVFNTTQKLFFAYHPSFIPFKRNIDGLRSCLLNYLKKKQTFAWLNFFFGTINFIFHLLMGLHWKMFPRKREIKPKTSLARQVPLIYVLSCLGTLGGGVETICCLFNGYWSPYRCCKQDLEVWKTKRGQWSHFEWRSTHIT